MSKNVWSASRLATAVAVAAMLAAPQAASAQFARTGASTVDCAFGTGACDANWSVSWYGISALTAGQNGSLANAAIATNIPSPPWTPNGPTTQWIAAAPNASLSPSTGDNASNYRYFFQTTFSLPQSSQLTFGLGWDNKLVGAFLGNLDIHADGSFDAGTAVALLPGTVATPFAGGASGFCRDGDGVLPSSAYPNCLTNVSVGLLGGQPQTLTFVIQGDGTTDGLLAGAGTITTATPEPASLALMGTGLLALGGITVRRRKSSR